MQPQHHFYCLALLAAALCPLTGPAQEPQVRVLFQSSGQPQTVTGRRIAADQAGGLCLQDDAGALWLIEGPEVVESEQLAEPFSPASAEELSSRILEELGRDFQVHTTPHYLVAYSTSRGFARWLSSLLERLHRAYTNYWGRRGVELHEPEFPLVVVVYQDQAAYRRAAARTPGAASPGVVGFYNLLNNRVAMYDLTGVESLRSMAGKRTSLRDINRMLRAPAATPLVTTIVHEATHQVAFNTGVTQRLANLPLWYVEGMAIYFEAPDLTSSRRWSGIGRVNMPRLATFRSNLPNWDAQRLTQLVSADRLFRDPQTAADAYAEAWALTYYLVQYREDAYTTYAQHLANQPPFVPSSAESRLAEFEEHFGPVEELREDLVRTLSRVR